MTVVQHYQLNGYEFEQTPGDDEGQGNLAYCCPWDRRVRHDLATKQQLVTTDVFPKIHDFIEEEIDWEFGIDMNTLPCLKINNQ